MDERNWYLLAGISEVVSEANHFDIFCESVVTFAREDYRELVKR